MTETLKLRQFFAQQIHDQMKVNSNLMVVSGDLGYKLWDQVRTDFPDRFINVGAAEQLMVGTTIGLAISGKIPIVYSISPFLLFRPFETIRNYLHHEKIPVKLVGSGRDQDYGVEGYSHWITEDREILKALPNIKTAWPNNNQELESIITEMLVDQLPWYLNLSR